MSNYNQLKKKKSAIQTELNNSFSAWNELSQECNRVADVAYNANIIISDIDRQFEQKTKLTEMDIIFLFLAIGLQCIRQYVLPSTKLRVTAAEGDKLIKNSLKNFVPKSRQDILFGSVPYDAIGLTEDFRNAGYTTHLSGRSRRYMTAGHDPILGWLVGPINILSDTLTKSDLITTYTVQSNKIAGLYPTGTVGAFYYALNQIKEDNSLFPMAVVKQAIHFGSDYFTTQGLPIPLMGTLNPKSAKNMVEKYNIDLFSISRSMILSSLINFLISCIHGLFYDASIPSELYKIRTNKIIDYSNLMATTSNVVYVALAKQYKNLDVGGMIITLHRIISDSQLKKQIKQEFLEKEFYKIVMEKGRKKENVK